MFRRRYVGENLIPVGWGKFDSVLDIFAEIMIFKMVYETRRLYPAARSPVFVPPQYLIPYKTPYSVPVSNTSWGLSHADYNRGPTGNSPYYYLRQYGMIVDANTGETKPDAVEVEAPLLSLVPVPAFTMDEATVKFTMEVKESTVDKITVGTENTFSENFGIWGFSTGILTALTVIQQNCL